MSFESKVKFGVTFNNKMSSKQASDIWFSEVPSSIRNAPENTALNNEMINCQAQAIQAFIKQTAYEIQQKAEDILKATVEAAAAIAAGIMNLPAQIAAKVAALLDLNIQIGLAASCQQRIHQEIDNLIPSHIP